MNQSQNAEVDNGQASTALPHQPEPGSPWQRIVGRAIDHLLIFGPLVVGASLLESSDASGAATVTFWLLMLAVIALYDLVMVGLFATTLGKAAMGLRVVDATGERAGWDVATRRWVLKLLHLVPVLGVLGVLGIGVTSLVYLFTDPSRQAVHDRVATSFVVTTGEPRSAPL